MIARLGLVWLCIGLIGGCASTADWPDNSNGHHERPEKIRLAEVPFHPQERYQCGPAALATMLGARGIETTPEALVGRVYLPERGGTLQVEMVSAAREKGLVAYPLRAEFEVLLEEVAAGNPVLVMQNLRFGWWPQWHYAVVMGYDRNNDAVFLHTDTRQAHPQPRSVFTRTWNRADHWALVIVPPDELPATAEPLPWLRAASDLEAIGQLQGARRAYKTALRHWPEQPAARFGLGNVAYQQGEMAKATHHLLTLTRSHPRLAAGWNNLSVVLEAQGCSNAAAVSRHCHDALKGQQSSAASSGQQKPTAPCPVVTCPDF